MTFTNVYDILAEESRETINRLATENDMLKEEVARLQARLSTERSILDNAPVWAELANCPPETVIGIRYEQIIEWQYEIARLQKQVAELERIIARETEKTTKAGMPGERNDEFRYD